MATTTPTDTTPTTAEAPRTFGNYIAGEWRPSASGVTFDDTNPARTSEVVARFQRSTAADVDAAIAAAEAALPAWRAHAAPQRGEIILRAALLLEGRRRRAGARHDARDGQALHETMGDVQTAIDFGKFVAGEGRRAEGETVPSAHPRQDVPDASASRSASSASSRRGISRWRSRRGRPSPRCWPATPSCSSPPATRRSPPRIWSRF